MKKVLVLNGANLNRLGKREPHIYGSKTLEDIQMELEMLADQLECEIAFKQSNHEGELIDFIHKAEEKGYQGLIINPGAFTHYSYAIRDALASVSYPIIEVHISNIHAREVFRQHSVIAPVVNGQIVGLGTKGYKLALMSLIKEDF